MEWLTCIKATISYIENHLLDDISIEDIASNVYISSYYLQTGFLIMSGYSIGEYIRNRRLSNAAKDLKEGKKVIDVALCYKYETPSSFSKAFKRYHGFNPSKIHQNTPKIFNPLTINININGGDNMELKYKIVTMFPLKLIGFVREFDSSLAFKEIPEFWDEICVKYCYPRIYQGKEPQNEYEKAIVDNCIGEYGVCVDGVGSTFKYLIAGKYCGGNVPLNMELYEFKGGEWAVFDCYGPCPNALQNMTQTIFKKWLPLNDKYELREDASIEWYDCLNGEKTDNNYHTQIWLPIREIKK